MTAAKLLAALGLLLVPGCVGDDGGLPPLVQMLLDVALPAGGGGVLGTLVAGRSLKKGNSRSQPQIDAMEDSIARLEAQSEALEREIRVEREERRLADSRREASPERFSQLEGPTT